MSELSFNVEEVARAIEIPVEHWPGACYGIACSMLAADLVETGEPRYGHWTGPVSDACPVESWRGARGGFVRHGWVEVPEDELCRVCVACGHIEDEHAGGFFSPCEACEYCSDFEPEGPIIVDPTRWVFEGVEPYIYVGAADHYDRGGNRLKRALMRPAPALDPSEPRFPVEFGIESAGFVRAMLGEVIEVAGTIELTRSQLFWLGNLPLDEYAHHARYVYKAMDDAGHGAVVPVDNFRAALGLPCPVLESLRRRKRGEAS